MFMRRAQYFEISFLIVLGSWHTVVTYTLVTIIEGRKIK